MKQKRKPIPLRVRKTAEQAKKRCAAWWFRSFPGQWEWMPELDAVTEGLKTRAGSFVGLYEPVYQVSRGAVRFGATVFGEWCLRVENLELDDEFSHVFLALFSNAEAWDEKITVRRAAFLLSCFERAGILRDTRRAFTADPSTGNWYSSMDGEDVMPGNRLKVKKPCWKQGEKLMERGIATQTEQHTNNGRER